jgi:hypothetical protein
MTDETHRSLGENGKRGEQGVAGRATWEQTQSHPEPREGHKDERVVGTGNCDNPSESSVLALMPLWEEAIAVTGDGMDACVRRGGMGEGEHVW